MPRSLPAANTRRSDPGTGCRTAAHVTGDEIVAAMDKVSVDGAIYISPFSMYAIDGSYAVEVQHARLEEVRPISRHARPQLRFLALLKH
jgi:L-fuconolactonase